MIRLTVLCLLQFSAIVLHAADKQPTIEKAPAWITANTIDYTQTQLDDDANDGYADLAFEQQVSLEHNAVYYKTALHILSEAGVQNSSQVSVEFDPGFQKLCFHSIKIIRGSEVIDQLKLSRIKTIQQEKELNAFLYNGTLTAFLILEDVRKDDIIEYSYTIKGFNPIFKNKYADRYLMKFSVPVYHTFYKLIVPKTRAVTIKNNGTNIKPVSYPSANSINYEWSLKNTTAVEEDENIPGWYDCYPTVMVSEYGSWKEVADWAAELFPFTGPLPANLQKKVAEIKAKNTTVEDQVLAAMHFVQDDVRYMGIEMGENSHKPHSPAQILNQRFGDCKDKAYLLCTLLRAMGVEAYPVLNNTAYKKSIGNWLPSHYAFDHTTVCAVVNAKTYWFDATIAYQKGPLESISYPDYQKGLVVKAGTTGLVTIGLQETGKMVARETFYVTDLNEPVRLVVVTTSTGSFADDVRYSFKNSSIKEIQKSYKKMYAAYFKNVKSDSLTYTDNEQSGLFTSTEYYTIPDFWEEKDGKERVLIEPYFINTVIKKPKEEARKMPFSLVYPARYEEEIVIHLPEDWPAQESNHTFDETSFGLHYSYSTPEDDVVMLKYSYENKEDHVKAEETLDYLQRLEEAEETIAYEISKDKNPITSRSSSGSVKTTPPNGFTIAYTLLSVFAVATYFYRRKKRVNDSW